MQLEQPQVHAIIDRDGALNLARLAPAAPAKPAKPAKPETDNSLPALRISALGVVKADPVMIRVETFD